MTALTTFAGVKIGAVLDQAREVCAIARDTFDAGYKGLTGMRSAVEDIDLALARWNASAASAGALAARPATEKEIGGALLAFTVAFPQAAKLPELSAGVTTNGRERKISYGTFLAEDVIDAVPSIGALAAGLENLRKTSKFLPSIAEVLEAIKAAEDPLRAAPVRVEELKIRREELAAQIADAERRAAARPRAVISKEGT